jgi:enterochelin esterase family protein
LLILLVSALAGCGLLPGADRSTLIPSTNPASGTLEFPTQAPRVEASPTSSPLPPNTPTPACNDTQGSVVEDQYQGHNVRQDVPILVYLPPCYATMPGPLPVMYLLHGKPFTEQHWVDLGVVGAERARSATAEAAHWVLVMPRVPEPLFSSTDGGPGSYEDEFTGTLMPYIESSYAVRRDPGGRAIAGISRGGVWSLEIGLRHPELFATVIALSPALAVNHPRPAYDPFRIVTSMDSLPAHIFLGAGDDDWAKPQTQKLLQELTARGVEPDSAWVPGAHTAATWEALVPQMLALADEWLAPSSTLP